MNQPGKIQGLDGVRALACLWVVAHHVFILVPSEVREASYLGWMLFRGDRGVPIFFVLSGLLLSMPLLKGYRDGRSPRWDVYLVRRMTRILPGYYACLLLCALAQSRTRNPPDWGAVLLSFGFVNSFFPRSFYPLVSNTPLWSIGAEVIFYGLLPPFMLLVSRCRTPLGVRAVWLAVTLGILVGNYFFVEQVMAWRGVASPSGGDAAFGPWEAIVNNPIALFAHFLVGVLTADVLLSARRAGGGDPRPEGAASRANAFDVIAIACLVLIFTFDVGRWVPGVAVASRMLHVSYDFPFFHLLVAGLLVSAALSGFMGRTLDNPFFRMTATLSFGIYLWHNFLLLSLGVIRPSLVRPGSIGEALRLYALLLPIAFGVAALSYYLLENPILRRGHRYKAASPAGTTTTSELGPAIGKRELEETRAEPTA